MPFFCGKGKETEFSFEMINQIIRQFINVKKTKKQKNNKTKTKIQENCTHLSVVAQAFNPNTEEIILVSSEPASST